MRASLLGLKFISTLLGIHRGHMLFISSTFNLFLHPWCCLGTVTQDDPAGF